METLRIMVFYQEGEGHWMPELDCDDQRYMRHHSPFRNRPWVIRESGQRHYVGMPLTPPAMHAENVTRKWLHR